LCFIVVQESVVLVTVKSSALTCHSEKKFDVGFDCQREREKNTFCQVMENLDQLLQTVCFGRCCGIFGDTESLIVMNKLLLSYSYAEKIVFSSLIC